MRSAGAFSLHTLLAIDTIFPTVLTDWLLYKVFVRIETAGNLLIDQPLIDELNSDLAKMKEREAMSKPLLNFQRILSLLVFAVASIAQAGQPLRYLPPTPVNFGNSIITNYGPVVHFDQSVRDETKDIDVGNIRFDYTHSFEVENNPPNPPNDPLAGGAALAGGLVLNENIAVKEGFNLAWVQTILATTSTTAAQNNWGVAAVNPAEYPDAGLGSPAYGSASLPAGANNPNPNPDFAFQDFPRRGFANGQQSWLAELGLACIAKDADDNGFFEVRVVNTFLWGFGINPQGALTLADVSATTPFGWSAPTASYLNTLNNAYDGTPGTKHTFAANSNCFRVIPEPGTMLLILPGMAVLLRYRRR